MRALRGSLLIPNKRGTTMQKLKKYIAVLLLCISVCGYPRLCYGENAPVSTETILIHPLSHQLIKTTSIVDGLRDFGILQEPVDYLPDIKEACLTGDVEAGCQAVKSRNEQIEDMGLSDEPFSFEDLFELSKIITTEIGSSWYPIEWKMMVGEVVLNRVASPEYPDTIYDVIHQKGQYQNAGTTYFDNLLPLEDCVDVAVRLLSGERLINDIRVVAQSGKERGAGTFAILKDTRSGAVVYLCYTNFPELYEDSEVNYGDCNDTKIYIYSSDHDDR